MLALSIRQPWASLIINHGKDIENRGWSTRVRGRILVHAAKGCTRRELEDGLHVASMTLGRPVVADLESVTRGGFIGTVEIVDCVPDSGSPWFYGPFGFVLRNPEPIEFIPWRGQLGFFDVPWPMPAREKSDADR